MGITPYRPKRRWLAFRLRTLLVFVAVASVPMAWVGHSLNWIRERHRLLDHGNCLQFGDCHAPGILRLLGEQGCEFLIYDPMRFGEAEVHRLFPESNLIGREGFGQQGTDDIVVPYSERPLEIVTAS